MRAARDHAEQPTVKQARWLNEEQEECRVLSYQTIDGCRHCLPQQMAESGKAKIGEGQVGMASLEVQGT